MTFYANSIQNKSLNSCTQALSTVISLLTLLDYICLETNLNKDHLVVMLESIKLYHIKGEELYFFIPFVM